MSRPNCCICNEPFTDEEWFNRHWLHEEHCYRLGSEWVRDGDCQCDLDAHEECCNQCL